jgi:hypothetical protein
LIPLPRWAVLAALASTLACGSGSSNPSQSPSPAYSTVDLMGTWWLNGLATGPGAPWWVRSWSTRADGSCGAAGDVSDDDRVGRVDSYRWICCVNLSPDGVGVMNRMSCEYPGARAAMDAGGSVLVATDAWDDGTAELDLFVKMEGAYSLSDLAGTWEAHSLAAGPGQAWWRRATVTVAPDGTFVGSTIDSNGARGSTSGTLAFLFDGSRPDREERGVLWMAERSNWRGVIDAGKSVLVATDTWDDATTELAVFVKIAGSHSLSDLAGKWWGHSLWAGPGGAHGWERSESTCASDGTCEGTSTSSVGNVASNSRTFTISQDGVVSVTQLDGHPVLAPAQFGVVDAGNTVIVSTLGPDDQGNVRLQVKLKMR